MLRCKKWKRNHSTDLRDRICLEARLKPRFWWFRAFKVDENCLYFAFAKHVGARLYEMKSPFPSWQELFLGIRHQYFSSSTVLYNFNIVLIGGLTRKGVHITRWTEQLVVIHRLCRWNRLGVLGIIMCFFLLTSILGFVLWEIFRMNYKFYISWYIGCYIVIQCGCALEIQSWAPWYYCAGLNPSHPAVTTLRIVWVSSCKSSSPQHPPVFSVVAWLHWNFIRDGNSKYQGSETSCCKFFSMMKLWWESPQTKNLWCSSVELNA